MKKQMLNNKKGFTLLEVLVAMLILAVGIAGTGALLVGVIRTNHLGNQMSKATTAAQLTMEEIRQTGFFNIEPSSNQSITDSVTGGYNYPSTFTRTVEIDDIDEDWVKHVTVTVNFLSFGTHRVVLDTIIAR